MWKRLRALYRDASVRADHSPSPWARRPMALIHIGVALAHKALRDRLGMRAAMLAFWTAISVVPVLMLAFALTGPLGLTDQARDLVREFLYQTILANSVEEVGATLDALLAATSLRTLGIAGVIGLMIAGAQLYFTVERTYNELYGARVRRSPLLRFLVYYAAITFGPLLVGWGLINVSGLGDPGFWTGVISTVLTAAVLVSAIWLLPDTDVRWRAAIVGGLFSAAIFEAAKEGFSLYMALFGGRSGLTIAFGSLAFIPFSLLWIEVVWIVVLLGVDLAYVIQHRSWLLAAEQAMDTDEDAAARWPDGTFAVSVMTLLADRFTRGEGAADPHELAARLGAEPAAVLTTLNVLEDAGLVLATKGGAFGPALPPEQVRATEVLRRWRAHAGLSRGAADPLARRVAARLDAVESALDVPLSELARPAEPAAEDPSKV